MTLPKPIASVHESHLVSTTAPFCEKCSARGQRLAEPCPISDDAIDTAERMRRATECTCPRFVGFLENSAPPASSAANRARRNGSSCPVHGEVRNG